MRCDSLSKIIRIWLRGLSSITCDSFLILILNVIPILAGSHLSAVDLEVWRGPGAINQREEDIKG